MTKRDIFCLFALLSLIIAEISTIFAEWTDSLWPLVGLLISVISILVIWIIGNSMNLEFKTKSVVISNLLANVISPRLITVFYLLIFVVHIGWLTDGSLNLFFPDEHHSWVKIIISIACGFIGILVLVIFFPRSTEKKDNQTTMVFISGMSIPAIPYIRPDELQTDEYKYRKLNLRPLVRILQTTSDEESEKCQMLILLSNGIKQDDKEKIRTVLLFVNESYKEEFDNKTDIEDCLKLLIKAVAEREFPNKAWIKNIEKCISFTKPCDYDDFKSCYTTLNSSISEVDDKYHHLHFNITPGTSNIGGIMTLMAMDPKRELYYYRQNEDIIDDNDRLRRIEKDYESLKHLFSEHLENIQETEL